MSGNMQDQDIHLDLSVTLEEAATGKTETVRVLRREVCESCAGTGSSWRSEDGSCVICGSRGWLEREKVLSVRVPAGVETGAVLRIAGEGQQDAASGLRADVRLTIKVSEHELFERRGKDLYTSVALPAEQIKAGAEAIVPTLLDGRKQLHVPPKTPIGTMLRMAGLGLRSLESSERGDLFVKLETPESLAKRERKAATASPAPTPAEKRRAALNRIKAGIAAVILVSLGSAVFFISLSSGRSASPSGNENTSPARGNVNLRGAFAPRPTLTDPVVKRTPVSLPNGTNITPPQGPGGDNSFTIVNGTYYDVAVKLVNQATQKTRRFVYVRAGNTARIGNLPREVCVLRIMSGEDWDKDARKFLSNLSFYEFDKPFDLRRTRWTVDLKPNVTGTLRDVPINEQDFEDK